MEQSIIYVLSVSGQPLMPTKKQRKVWYWLRKGLAHVVRREPFTIQLHFATTSYVQPAKVGVDTGSQTVGIAAIVHGEVFYQAEVCLRTDIADKMLQRRQYRRVRRSRKTRYRPARWANRHRPKGWLPPSLRSKCDATAKAVRFVSTLLPVQQVTVEIASFDTHKMQNPEISGIEYQQGELCGYQVREYVLEKWHRTCAYCGRQGGGFQIEHIVPKARGGSDRISNLTLACGPCNGRKGTRTAEEFGHPEVQARARVPLRDAAHVSAIKTAVIQQLVGLFGPAQVAVTYGYETKFKRIQILGLPKSHANDAVAIACALDEKVKPLGVVYRFRCLPRGTYQRYNGKHSEHRVWAPKKIQGWKVYEQVEAKGMVGYIGGRRVKGAFVLKEVRTGKALGEVTPRKLRRLARPMHGWIVQREEGRASSSD